MPRFAANLSLLFAERPYAERFAAAAAAGFTAVEVLFPYEFAAHDTRRALDENGLDMVLINAPFPRYAGGAPGFAAIPDGQADFQRAFRETMEFARLLRPERIHVMAGHTDAPGAKSTFVENLRWAADQAPDQGFCIEPLNLGDQPGYFLADYHLAAEILAEVDRPNVGLQYDSYHAQVIHGDALAIWDRYRDLVSHVQIGNPPERSEPGPGGPVDFAALFRAIDDSGYAGWVSAEYYPSRDRTEDTLGWLPGRLPG